MNRKKIFCVTVDQMLEQYAATFAVEHPRVERVRQQLTFKEFPSSERGTTVHITGSGIVLHRASASVLLIHHRGIRNWIQPGGHLQGGELPQEAAQREVVRRLP